VFLADEEADRAALVAIDHGAGWRSVNTELVLDRMRAHVVAFPERAVGVEQELRHQKQRDAFGAGQCVRQPRQYEMNDVVGEVMLAISNEDLLTGEPVAAIAGALGLGPQ